MSSILVHRHLLLLPEEDEAQAMSGRVDHTAFFQGERKRRHDRNKSAEQLLVRLVYIK